MSSEKVTPLTNKQMKESEKFICAMEISDFAKKTIIWLLRQSENMTKEVALKFPEKPKRVLDLGKEFAFAAHPNKDFQNLIKQMGGSMVLYGYYGGGGLGASLAFKYYSNREEELSLNIDEIMAVELN